MVKASSFISLVSHLDYDYFQYSYAFLAGLAYRSENVTQTDLDAWFNGRAVDETEIVKSYREEAQTSSHVSFKLVTLPTANGAGDFAFVLIRGTVRNKVIRFIAIILFCKSYLTCSHFYRFLIGTC